MLTLWLPEAQSPLTVIVSDLAAWNLNCALSSYHVPDPEQGDQYAETEDHEEGGIPV